MFKKAIPLLLPLLLIFTHCKDEEDEGEQPFVCPAETITPCDIDSNKVNLRIVNVTGFDYCNVHIHDVGKEANYGEILSGDTSCYIVFNNLYSEPNINLYIEQDTLYQEAGEYIPVVFSSGFYICPISVNNTQVDREWWSLHMK